MLSFQRAAITTDQRSFHDKKGKIQPAQCSRLATPIPKKNQPIQLHFRCSHIDHQQHGKTRQDRTRQNKAKQDKTELGRAPVPKTATSRDIQIIDTSAYIVAYRNHMNRINRKGAIKACAHQASSQPASQPASAIDSACPCACKTTSFPARIEGRPRIKSSRSQGCRRPGHRRRPGI